MPETSGVPELPRGYEFGPFRVDVHGGAVYRGETRLPLVPKAVDLLQQLLAARGEVVTRHDLLRDLWPDAVVEEGNITKLVFQLRQALAEVPEYASAIETIPKRGYRFLGQVREISGPSRPTPARDDAPRLVLPLPLPHPPGAGGELAPSPSPRLRSGVSRTLWFAITAMTALALAVVLWSHGHRTVATAGPDRRSIAILPFKNLGDDPVASYFGDGLAEDIVTHLSKVPGLRVISRASTHAYRDSTPPLRTIGTELGVGTVLEGSVRRNGDQTRITIQLTDTTTGGHLWAETYDRDVNDLLGVQSDVASKVAGILALRLDRTDGTQLRGGTRQPEAYDLYLRALSELDRWLIDDSMRSAIAHLEKAVALDPNFARAHAQLAWAYARAGLRPNADDAWYEKTRAEARRALDLEPELALPHVAQSFLLWSWPGGWDYQGAIRELRRAQELEPSIGHLELGVLFGHLGLDEVARRELDLALSYNPRSHWVRDRTIGTYFWLGRWSEAYARAREWFTEEEAIFIAWQSAIHVGHADKVLRSINPAKDRVWRPKRAMVLATTGGPPDEVRALVQAENDSGRSKRTTDWHHWGYNIACIEALLGDQDTAVRYLRNVAEGGFPNYLLFSKDPYLDSLRTHPGFVQLMAELKPKWEQWRAEYR